MSLKSEAYRLCFIEQLARQNFPVPGIGLLELFQEGLRAVTLRAFGGESGNESIKDAGLSHNEKILLAQGMTSSGNRALL